MAQTAVQTDDLVEEIVADLALTGDVGEVSLTEQVQLAASGFDRRRTKAAVRALLTKLTEDPQSSRELEALVILGLAHQRVLRDAHVPLGQEGRRLAVILEQRGDLSRAIVLMELLANRFQDDRQIERDFAAMLRRTGNSGRLVDRYLSRAESAVEDGRSADAIPLLQEILLVDRSRRDVARMIRDLRYQEAERIARRRKILRRYLVTLLLISLTAAVAWREWKLNQSFVGLETAAEADNLRQLQQRLAEVDGLLDDNPFWIGAVQAIRKRAQIEQEIEDIERQLRADGERAMRETAVRMEEAEAARLRGRDATMREDYVTALAEFSRALELGTPDWGMREQIEKDVQAIATWQEKEER